MIAGSGMIVSVLDDGCAVAEVCVPDKNHSLADICLGYDVVAKYEANDGYLGVAVGRHAGRIQNGRFSPPQTVSFIAVQELTGRNAGTAPVFMGAGIIGGKINEEDFPSFALEKVPSILDGCIITPAAGQVVK